MKNIIRDARGFSHELVLVTLVVIVGVAGSAFLVLSHADTCPTTSGVTSYTATDVSATNCPPVSPVVSYPVTSAGSCTIAMNPSTTPPRGSQVQFLITVHNTGSNTFTPALTASVYNRAPTARGDLPASSSTLTAAALSPGQSATITYDKAFTAPANKAITGGYMQVASTTNSPAFSCRVDFTLALIK
jgi:hypothetical protein